MPERRLAPSTFEATVDPPAEHAAASSAVVVDLPFVPETTAMRRPAASSSSASGASASVTFAPMTDPPPRPMSRDVALVAAPNAAATRVRAESRGAGSAIDSVTG